jgi:hypothetical protein
VEWTKKRAARGQTKALVDALIAKNESLFEIDLATHEDVRSDPTWFVIVPGHEVADASARSQVASRIASMGRCWW